MDEADTPIKRAIAAVGSQAALAALLSAAKPNAAITQQAISYWARNNVVPAERVLDIERVTGVSRHELRPDLYPQEETAA